LHHVVVDAGQDRVVAAEADDRVASSPVRIRSSPVVPSMLSRSSVGSGSSSSPSSGSRACSAGSTGKTSASMRPSPTSTVTVPVSVLPSGSVTS
jgi:hypothetical protein